MEERLEKLEELSQRQEEDRRDLAKHTRPKARFPRRLRQQGRQRLADAKEKQKKFDQERAEQLRVAEKRAERTTNWLPSPKKLGMWTEQWVWDALADGTVELRKKSGCRYLVTEVDIYFLGLL
jgi:hypothetical protein